MNSGKLLTSNVEDNPEPRLAMLNINCYSMPFELVKSMLTVNKYKDILLEEFYLDKDDMTIRRNKDGYRGRFAKHDKVNPYKLCKHGYGGIHIPKTRTTVPYHQLLTLLRGIDIPDNCVLDHIDGDTNSNSRSNIRVVSQALNCRNSKKAKNNTSGYTGINWNKSANSYTVRKYLNGKRVYLGSTETLEDAVLLLRSYEGEIRSNGYTDRHGK